KKLIRDVDMASKIDDRILRRSRHTLQRSKITEQGNRELAYLLVNESRSTLTANNDVKLLINGEKKFPDVLDALKQARNHIHIEYYIFDDDEIGRAIESVLIQKAQEGVMVRFIYDDFGSRSIRRKMVRRLKTAGVKVFPFNKIVFIALANRLNY